MWGHRSSATLVFSISCLRGSISKTHETYPPRSLCSCRSASVAYCRRNRWCAGRRRRQSWTSTRRPPSCSPEVSPHSNHATPTTTYPLKLPVVAMGCGDGGVVAIQELVRDEKDKVHRAHHETSYRHVDAVVVAFEGSAELTHCNWL